MKENGKEGKEPIEYPRADKSIQCVVCYLMTDTHAIMARKKRKIGVGLLCGYGGKIEPGESPKAAVIREVYVETNGVVIDPSSLYYAGMVDFYNHEPEGTLLVIVKIFLATKWSGKPKETEEMGEACRVRLNELPFHDMMAGDRFFLKDILESRKTGLQTFAVVHYDGPGQRKLLKPAVVVRKPGQGALIL